MAEPMIPSRPAADERGCEVGLWSLTASECHHHPWQSKAQGEVLLAKLSEHFDAV